MLQQFKQNQPQNGAYIQQGVNLKFVKYFVQMKFTHHKCISIPDICHFPYTGRIFKFKILHPKIPQKYPKSSRICSFLRSIQKILHLTELFYTGTARGARDKYQVWLGCFFNHWISRCLVDFSIKQSQVDFVNAKKQPVFHIFSNNIYLSYRVLLHTQKKGFLTKSKLKSKTFQLTILTFISRLDQI